MRLQFPQTRKAWVSLIGATITTAAVAWGQFGDLTGLNPQTITAIGGLLSAIGVFFVPNADTTGQPKVFSLAGNVPRLSSSKPNAGAAGALGGALIGAVTGGPVGLVVGGVLGGLGGVIFGQRSDSSEAK